MGTRLHMHESSYWNQRGEETPIELLCTQPHVKVLAQHVKGELGMPAGGRPPSWTVNVLLDTGPGVTSIS